MQNPSNLPGIDQVAEWIRLHRIPYMKIYRAGKGQIPVGATEYELPEEKDAAHRVLSDAIDSFIVQMRILPAGTYFLEAMTNKQAGRAKMGIEFYNTAGLGYVEPGVSGTAPAVAGITADKVQELVNAGIEQYKREVERQNEIRAYEQTIADLQETNKELRRGDRNVTLLATTLWDILEKKTVVGKVLGLAGGSDVPDPPQRNPQPIPHVDVDTPAVGDDVDADDVTDQITPPLNHMIETIGADKTIELQRKLAAISPEKLAALADMPEDHIQSLTQFL